MMAGTDVSSISVSNSSRANTVRLTMTLLTTDEALNIASSIDENILLQNVSMRHIFYLGGNPRWVTMYCQKSSLDAEAKYEGLKNKYINGWGNTRGNFFLLFLIDFLR